jgi:acyl-CoA thioesterase FadM
MNLRFRFLILFLNGFLGRRQRATDDFVLNFRALPTDVDVIRMFNNRFFSFMDLGRWDYILRTGMFGPALKGKWAPLVTSEIMKIRRSISLLQKFSLHTKLLYWDEKGFYFEQRFVRSKETVAVCLVRGVLYGKGGAVNPIEVFRQAGQESLQRPPMPEVIAKWLEGDRLLT